MFKRYSKPLTASILVLGLGSCEVPRDEQQINNKTWADYLADGPAPERFVQKQALSPKAVSQRKQWQEQSHQQLTNAAAEKQILFGDTHVHTTFSNDAIGRLLPVANGNIGAFPPSDACDYARYISQLDFYFLSDHAKSYTPENWDKAIDTVRNCNRVAGDPNNPDLVAFMGYEWTQIGRSAEQHYGHHNVLYRDTGSADLPPRPIAAIRLKPGEENYIRVKPAPELLKYLNPQFRQYYQDHKAFIDNMNSVPLCPEGVASQELPKNCLEYANDPLQLYRKLNEFGKEAIVIQHGMAWGNSAPPDASWDHYFDKGMVNNKIVRLLEVYSGHGNSEEYRNFKERDFDSEGKVFCPETSASFLPGCRQAGRLIEQYCLAEGHNADTCQQRKTLAQQYFVEDPSRLAWLVVPGSEPIEWLDAGQCRDCFLPAFSYRPKKSAQYGLAKKGFDIPGGDDRFRWGFVGSTDTHRSAAGHGFKQTSRLYNTDSDGHTKTVRWLQEQKRGDKSSIPRRVTQELATSLGGGRDQERLTSYLTLGGLAAVHSQGRNREAIWEALKRRETYATSGHKMLLWFDLVDGEQSWPMGSSITRNKPPRFRARAIGSFKQMPGCPEHIKATVKPEVLQRLGFGECYNPSDQRLKISRIEVIRIRPQQYKNESIQPLIEDVWRSFDCDDQGNGCEIEFTDLEFSRDSVYYVRAIEEATPTINGANLRTRFDDKGNAISIEPCYGDERTSVLDNCLADIEHRAWSSPIYVDHRS